MTPTCAVPLFWIRKSAISTPTAIGKTSGSSPLCTTVSPSSAREATEQKVVALDLGADDYVTKPFDTEEVLARIRTALRHRLSVEAETPVVLVEGIEINLATRQVRREGEEVHLTPKEYGFLAELAKRPGRVLTHAQLLKAVWGAAHERDVEYLRVAARSIRKKLETTHPRPR